MTRDRFLDKGTDARNSALCRDDADDDAMENPEPRARGSDATKRSSPPRSAGDGSRSIQDGVRFFPE